MRGRNAEIALWTLLLLLTTLAAWGCGQLFQPRAAFLQVGAMLGTIMAANVFFCIIPAHWELINAKKAGREPDPTPGILAGKRSVHNNYFTLPVLFTMLAGHFAFAYGAGRAWLVLIAIMLLGVLSRVFFNLRHQGRTIWALPVVGVVAVLLLAWAIKPDDNAARRRDDERRLLAGRSRDRATLRTVPFAVPDGARLLEPAGRGRARDARADRGAGERHQERRLDEGDAARQSHRHDERRARPRRRLGHPGRVHQEVGVTMLRITAGGFSFTARLEEEDAPETVAAFRRLLPLESRIIHVRWSGEAGWIPFGDLDLGLGPENATCYPNPGEIVLYPGGVSETEILLAYGYVSFASKAGALAGNHFATVVEGNENLRALGKKFLWEGAQEIVFSEE